MGLLRLLFAVSVLSAHTGPLFGLSLIGGKIAVQAFFIFSGFYMALILNEKYIKKRKSFKLFITNRILRIYPTYLIVLLATVIISYIFFIQGSSSKFDLYKQFQIPANPFLLMYLVFINCFILGMDTVMFLGLNVIHHSVFFTNDYLGLQPQLYDFLFVPQAWTLSLEFMFYCMAPFLVKRKTWVILMIIGLSILLRIYLYFLGLHREPWTNRFFPTELPFFLVGILAYRVYSSIKKKNIHLLPRASYIILIIFTIIYSFIPVSFGNYFDSLQWGYLGTLLLSIPFIFQLTRKSYVDRIFGMLSYPVYISHIFVSDLLVHFGQGSAKLFSLETVLLTLLVSAMLIIFIENPINKYRQRKLIV